MKILVLGASGMIGSTVFSVLCEQRQWEVSGVVRSAHVRALFPTPLRNKLCEGSDLRVSEGLVTLLARHRPNVVVNCAGVTKHLPEGNEPASAIAMNALFPHRLAGLCRLTGARLIHISTDCVFSGCRGGYREEDVPDAEDVYGRTKILGEVVGSGVLTLRTSTIGPELGTRHGLLEWFLAQSRCKGYRRAIFSGLPSVEFGRIIRDVVIPRPELEGLYHVAAAPIAKFDLLTLIAQAYGRDTIIDPDDDFVIDRSLNAERFFSATGYRAPPWPELIANMRDSHLKECSQYV